MVIIKYSDFNFSFNKNNFTGKIIENKEYWFVVNGKGHRLYGPCRLHTDGSKLWKINGNIIYGSYYFNPKINYKHKEFLKKLDKLWLS